MLQASWGKGKAFFSNTAPPPRQPLHLEALGLQLLRLLQPLEDLERQLPARLVLALALGLLQQLRHLEVLGLPQPFQAL